MSANPVQTLGTCVGDLSAWSTALLLRAGIAFQSLVNEFVCCIQFVGSPTKATGPYEKAGILVEGYQTDPSDYSNADSSQWITKDAVGVSASTQISNGNKTGRAWGLYGQAGSNADSDGVYCAAELGLDNRSSDQPNLDSTTSKVILSLVAGEGPSGTQKPITAFSVLESGSSSAHIGIVANRSAFVDQNEAPVYAVRDTDGTILSAMTANGGAKLTRFQLNPVESPTLPKDQFNPGDVRIWGDTSTGITYLVYFDGFSFLGFQLQLLGTL